VLDIGDASSLTTKLSGRRRAKEIALVALANYSKFVGKYKEFQELKERYNLKWNQVDPMKSFERFFNPDLNLDIMLQQIREMISRLPTSMGKIVHWGTLVGLRSSEIIESVCFINDKEAFPKYYDAATMTLNHWKMPGMIRKTKKAFLSFITPDMLSIVQNLDYVPSLNAITLACHREGIKMRMHLTRRIFASHLIQSGIDYNTVDMLSGRCPQSVILRHYQTPSQSLKDDVLAALGKLQQQL
jgi:hypothetical protein